MSKRNEIPRRHIRSVARQHKILGGAISLLTAFCGLHNVARGADAPITVISDVTVISPERPAPLEHAYVRIANGRIADVSRQPLKGDLTVDGRGKFLIPGLIDSHTH